MIWHLIPALLSFFQARKEHQLSARLASVRDLCLRPGLGEGPLTIADIGADHAKLSIALMKSGSVAQVIAIDVRESPLETGRRNARESLGSEFSNHIDFRLGDGLTPLFQNDEVDAVCVVGMGPASILNILSSNDRGEWESDHARALGVRRLILQVVDSRPHLMVPLRRWLCKNRWAICDETICSGGKDRNRIYLTILAERTNGPQIKASEVDLILPPSLRQRGYMFLLNNNNARTELSSRSSASKKNVESEFELWQSYLKHHLEWVRQSRFDDYDAKSGLRSGSIESALKNELASLSSLLRSED